jgi:hypothetical protein
VTWRGGKHTDKVWATLPFDIVRSQQPNCLSNNWVGYRQPSGCLNEYTQLSSISCLLFLHSILEDPYTFHKIFRQNIRYWDESMNRTDVASRSKPFSRQPLYMEKFQVSGVLFWTAVSKLEYAGKANSTATIKPYPRMTILCPTVGWVFNAISVSKSLADQSR